MDDVANTRGGARKGAGRKAIDGAHGLVPLTVKLTPEQRAWVRERGPAVLRSLINEAMHALPK